MSGFGVDGDVPERLTDGLLSRISKLLDKADRTSNAGSNGGHAAGAVWCLGLSEAGVRDRRVDPRVDL